MIVTEIGKYPATSVPVILNELRRQNLIILDNEEN